MADRFDELLAEMRRERAEWNANMDRRLEQTDELLRFVGELNRRGEIALQVLLREGRAMRREIRANVAEINARTEEIKARTEANTESSKAHTRAIFALIDRLEGGGGLAPAT